jgi:hypothetical protein
MTFAGIFAIVVGIGMLAQWVRSLVTRQIPELQSEPVRIGFHLAGEMVTAALLVIGGIGLLTAAPWASTAFFVSMGMLLYTAIVSPGYFAQRGQWRWTVVFGILIVLAIAGVLSVSCNAPF